MFVRVTELEYDGATLGSQLSPFLLLVYVLPIVSSLEEVRFRFYILCVPDFLSILSYVFIFTIKM